MNARDQVDALLALAGVRVEQEEYDRLVRLFPIIQAQLAELRIPEARDAEPAVIYPARDQV